MVFFGRIVLAATVALPMSFGAVRAAEDEPPPEIRAFDLPTIEMLGRAMYAQDQFAWKATDLMNAERGERALRREGVRGWIIVAEEGRDIVRFVRMNDDMPEALYDVVFMGDGPPQLYSPATPILTSEELAQYNARMLALENIEDPCSESYNTIVLPDPESDNWLVWAIAATTEPGVLVVGGHYRFTIAADGSEIVRTDRLYAGCLNLSQPDVPDGFDSFLSVGHVISLTPLETHVFTSMGWPGHFYVGTNDGRAWRLERGQLKGVDVADEGDDGAGARSLIAATEVCSAIFHDLLAAEGGYYPSTDTFHVTAVLEHEEEYPTSVPDGFELVGMMCVRKELAPLPSDLKLLRNGISMTVSHRADGWPERMVSYDFENGEFAAEVVDGEPLDAETQARIEARFAQFRAAMADTP